MPGFLRYRTLLACVALLALSAGWNFGVRAERADLKVRTTSDGVQADVAAGGLDKAILDAFKWRSIGPPRGGRSIAVSGVKGRAKEAYFGAVGGGLRAQLDGGVTPAIVRPRKDGQTAINDRRVEGVHGVRQVDRKRLVEVQARARCE